MKAKELGRRRSQTKYRSLEVGSRPQHQVALSLQKASTPVPSPDEECLAPTATGHVIHKPVGRYKSRYLNLLVAESQELGRCGLP